MSIKLSSQGLESALRDASEPERIPDSMRFFKTGPGQYGEGDLFMGVRVPRQREIARRFLELPLSEIESSLESPLHEMRLTALFILVAQFKKTKSESTKEGIIRSYEKMMPRVNNWDLVDSSAPYLTGPWYRKHRPEKLLGWARSGDLWPARIAMVSAFAWTRAGEIDVPLQLAEILQNHPHDLMHKAVGWVLREVGDVDRPALENWLKPRYNLLPRTMLRYTLEHFPKEQYKVYLEGRI